MKTADKNKILSEIFYKKRQLEQLKPQLGNSAVSNVIYNKILIEKAVLQKKLQNFCENKFTHFCKMLFKPKRKLISDYFKDNCPMI